MEAIISERTIAYGRNRYKVDVNGNWQALMFGTHSPACNGIPSYKFVPIPEERVPSEVKRAVLDKL